jgi:pilus retraction protein PilT
MGLSLSDLLKRMLEMSGSDLHITTNSPPQIRVHGHLVPLDLPQMTPAETKQLAYSVMTDSQKHRFEESLELDFSFGLKGLARFRANVFNQRGATAAVFRLIPFEIKSFNQLGLPAVVSKLCDKPRGLVLVTGPTGSGKTTTLYAALSEIKNDEDKIVTIEDPVEYQIKGITQIPVNEKKGLTFARGLRSILRHDPDKIMVGEIRDQETAQIAINAALTGHLVFTTVHANNVLDVLGRFLNMGVEAYNFVSALNCILAQRLVRVICPHCKKAVQHTDEYLIESGLNPETWKDVTLYEGTGCFECGGTGFRGRSAIHELLDLSEVIREMILNKRPASEIRRAAREEGMTFLRESAIEKARAGVTTLKEINKVTFIEG